MSNSKHLYVIVCDDDKTIDVVRGRGGYYFGGAFTTSIAGVYEYAAKIGASVERHDNPNYQPRRRKQTPRAKSAPVASSNAAPRGLAEMLRF